MGDVTLLQGKVILSIYIKIPDEKIDRLRIRLHQVVISSQIKKV